MKCRKNIPLLLAAVAAPVRAAYAWQNVNIGGGGGFIGGIVFHPTAKGVAYARTDIGGLYRLNTDDSWTPLTDDLGTDARWGNWGVDAVAVDPQNEDKVFAAVGMYTHSWDPNNGSIVRSSNKGTTWGITELPFKVGGNMPGRGMGERLAVDPKNSDIIYFGARSGNGLWRSTDGGITFSKVTSFTNVGTYIPDPTDASGYNADNIGLAFVTFDSTSPLLNGATSRIFVGTADNITASVYKSNDAGTTWEPVQGQPATFFPHKCKLQPAEKALYLTYSDGTGPYDGAAGAVYRYDLTNGTWKNITPVSGGDLYFGFGGLGLDMQNPGTLVVASLNSWWPDAQLFRSTDSGNTWSPIWEWAGYPDQHWYYGLYTDNAPWINAGVISQDSKRLGWMIETLEINPLDSDHWLYATGLTVFGGHDLTKWDTTRNVTISSLAVGIEEMAVLGLASAPGGSELLAAVGDNSGFTFRQEDDLGTSPQTPWMNPLWTSATDVDYAGNKPDNVVRSGNSAGSPQIALSADGGLTWNVHGGASSTHYGGSLAYSADADTILWSPSNSGPLRSQSHGTFTAVASLPSGAVIAAAKLNNTIFYAGSGSTFYRSTDTAATFTAVSSALGSAVTAVKDIVAHPAVAGEVWVSTNAGLFRSTDFGLTFTPVGTVNIRATEQISFGRGSGPSGWNIYAFGIGASGARLYASADSGATWVDIQGTKGFGSISANRVVGSANVPGQVYVGTNGRGVFYARGVVPGGETPPSSSSAAVVPSSTIVRSSSTLSTVMLSTTGASSSSSSRIMSSSTVITTSSVVPSSTSSTAPSASVTPVAQRWGQCGGISWTGPRSCVSPWKCTFVNDWYSQCL